MRKLYPIINAKSVPVRVRAFLFIALAVCMSLAVSTQSYGQCSGCTTTINTNASVTAGPGQVICITKNNYNGTITLNGGTVCITSGITVNPGWVYSAASTINNNGTIGTALTLGNGYILDNNSGATVSATLTMNTGSTVSNTGTISGTLTENGGAFTNNSGGTISGTSSISGTLTNNGSITNTVTVNNGGTFTNNSNMSAAVTMAAGSNFNNTSTYSGTLTMSGGTITNTGTISSSFTDNGIINNNTGGTLSGTLTVASGATISNTGTINNSLTVNNGGSVTNNSGGVISAGTTTINGTVTNNGSMTNSISIGATGSLTNNNSITGNITSMASGASFTNSSGATFNANLNGSSGSTVTDAGTMTINGGTMAGSVTQSAGILSNSGTISGAFNQTGGSATNNGSGTMSGGSTIAGTLTNNGTMSGTNTITATGTLTTGSNLSGTLIVNGIFNVNGGASPTIGSVTVNSGGTINNNGTLQGGTLTGNAGSTINNSGVISDATTTSGTLTNTSGGTISGTLTGNAGSTITNSGNITNTTTIAGTLTNNSGATISHPVIENTGGAITNSGTMNAGVTVNGGTFVDASGGTITSGGMYFITVNGGSVTLNANVGSIEVTGGTLNNNATNSGQINVTGGTVNNTGTISGSYTQNGGTVDNSGTISPSSLHLTAGSDSITNLSGGTLTFPSGTNTLPSGLVVTNYGTFTTTSPLTVSSGATLNLEGTQSMGSSQVTNNGTINLAGSLTVSTYTGTGALNEISGGCNTFTTSSNSGTGSFNGGQSTYGGGLIVNSYSGTSTYSNGASATITAPTQQPAGLSASLTGLTVSGSFTAPATGASITGYIVLRYIGFSAPTCTPVNNTTYTVGSTVGVCTVVALVAGGSTGSKSFTDNIPAGDCGENIYYEIYSYNGPGDCVSYDLTSPLTGAMGIPNFTTTITPAGPSTFCGSGTLTTSGGGTYQWNATGGSATTASITASASGTYAVTVTNTSGCTASASNVVTINPLPSAAITPVGPSTFCGSGTLTASGGGNYLWNATGGNAAVAGITASASGTYVVTVTTPATGCSASASNVVTINALPAAPTAVTATPASICTGGSSNLNATSAGNTIRWWTAATGGSMLGTSASGVNYSVTPASTTTYYAEALTAAGCASATRVAVTVTVNPLPGAPTAVTATPATICAGQTSQLNATSAGNTINWWTAATGGSLLGNSASGVNYAVTPASTTTYYAEALTASGCASASRVAVTVTINPVPTAVTVSGGGTSCGSATLTAAGGAGGTIYWENTTSGGTSTATPSASQTVSTSGTYYFRADNACGWGTQGSATVTINALPPVNAITGPTAVCAGSTITLSDATALGTWSSSDTAVATVSILGIVTGVSAGTATISYTVTNILNGCSNAATSTVTVNPLPAAAITPAGPSTFCGSGGLSASGGGNYLWNATGGNSASAGITASASGTYVVTVTTPATGCSASASNVVTINPIPAAPTAVTATPATICAGATSQLKATSAGNTIRWWTAASGGVLLGTSASGANYSVTPASTTTYYAEAYTAVGCASASRVAVTVTVNPLPGSPTAVTATPAAICVGATSQLNATSAGNTINWWTAATGGSLLGNSASAANFAVTPASTTTYYAEALAASGCVSASRVAVTVTVNPLPTPSVNNATSCSGATVTLTATGGASYHWNTGATTASITTAIAGTYTVTATSASGCTATASGTVTSSSPTITVNNPATCAGGTDTLIASGGGAGATYVWSTGSASDTITTTIAGVYHVTVTNSLGCTATASGVATVNALPTPAVANDTICGGAIATLTATGGVVYVWSTGATTASITTATAGTYTVTATSIGGCTASASGIVVVVADPAVTATNGVICSGSPATVTASGASNYVWSTGATTASISTTTAGTYSVTGTSSVGCTASANSTVTSSTNPTPTVNSISICAGNSGTITATAAGCTFVWSTGATTASITVSPATTTTYTVTATNASGCSATATGKVTVNALPTPTVNNGVVCSGASTTLTATGGTSYHWSTGATTASITTAVLGTYTVTATNAAGCTASVSGTVTAAVAPVATVNSTSACSGATSTLTATITAGGPCTYLWSTAATTASITVAPATTTTYTVTVTNISGCTASASGTITTYSLPTVSASSNSPILFSGTINLTSTASGGTSPYTYAWSGPSSYSSTVANPSISSATAANGGVYTITVTDNHGCTATTNTEVLFNSTAPGGVSSYNVLWLRANSLGLSNGGSVATWTNNAGGNNLTAPAATQPVYLSTSTDYINYYPVVSFNGSSQQMTAPSFSGNNTFSQADVYMVAKASNNSQSGFVLYEPQATSTSGESGRIGLSVPWSGTDYWDAGSCCSNNRLTANFPSSYDNIPQLYSFSKDTTGTANGSQQQDIRLNGLTTATKATNTKFIGNSSTFNLGSAGGGNYYAGEMAEVIYYLGAKITYAQENQIESYLATKYGITLDQTTPQNYTASNGEVFWNAASNGIYNKNIFGVGIDNVSTLSQTQSQSINTNQLTISNATGLTFYSFLMVSDSGSSLNLNQTPGLPNMINAAVATVWRVSQTGNRCSANYILNSSDVNFGYYAPISSSMTPYMLIDSNHDGIYETYLSATSTSGSNITFNAYLKDGARFTFGFKASIDYGDAWGVPTLTANNGAGHMIVPGVYLGALIDAELDGQPSVNALGDDTIGLADEDGVNFNVGVPTSVNIVTMGTNTITVTASVPGYLNAWADLNQNNTYEMDDEYLIINKHLVAGANTVTFTVSDSVLYGPTSMRFRFDTINGDVTGPTGLAKNGEVEDYLVYITAPLVGACTNGFQNPSFENGPDIGAGAYIITSETNLPYWRTTATDGMIEQWGNNYNGGGVNVPAYNGTYFVELEANLYGALYQDVYTAPGTKLSWSFAHRGRFGNDTCLLKIGTPQNPITQGEFIDGEFAWGVHTGFYTVPAGQYITRLAFDAVGSFGGNQSEGNFLDDVSVISSFDYGDAPNSYGTYFANSGPYHSITGNLYLGYGVTCDADGQPSAAANLDSLDDGITFPAPCNGCGTYTVNIAAYNNSGSNATVAGWIDFNKNGVFDNNERASITLPTRTTEIDTTLTFSVTAFSSVSSSTYGRFRIANDSTQIATPYGFAASGEVEDYLIPCVALPLPIPTISSPVCARGPLSLAASDSAYSNIWSGPNGFTSYSKDTTIASVPQADSGLYTIYAIYSNGCVTDSSVNIKVSNCFVNISGHIFDDANGNGIIDGTDATTDLGKIIYAVLSDNTNTVLQTTLVNASGAFTFSSAPAYETGMTILPKTTNPAIGGPSGGVQWPTNWTGTKEQYGTNNTAGSGIDATPNILIVNAGVNNISGALLDFDQLPKTDTQTYFIPYPGLNSQKELIPANSLGILAGSDPEDGTYTTGSTFTITSLAGMNGNKLYYNASGGSTLQPYEQITGYTTITNFDPTKLIVVFSGAGSTSATFNYGSTDAAGKVDPNPAPYTIKWVEALPVTMLYFTAEKGSGTQSLLKWATASEINNAYFEVERSADAETWESIGQVKGAGTTEVQTDYSMTDANPLLGVNYYRLKQVDVDGNFVYSDIAQVTFATTSQSSETTLSVYPNPMNQASKLNIQLNSATENISEVNIMDEMGQVVYKTTLPQIQNYQILGLTLPSGVYIVSVRTQENNVIDTKLVITR